MNPRKAHSVWGPPGGALHFWKGFWTELHARYVCGVLEKVHEAPFSNSCMHKGCLNVDVETYQLSAETDEIEVMSGHGVVLDSSAAYLRSRPLTNGPDPCWDGLLLF